MDNPERVQTFRDLIVWRKSIALVTRIYEITKRFPREELYGLTVQMRRCAVSIPSNIAEGHGRSSTNDYVRFLDISIGSLYELQTQIEISRNLDYITEEAFDSLMSDCREIERLLSSLIRQLRSRTPSNHSD